MRRPQNGVWLALKRCPLCGFEVRKMRSHLQETHNDGMNVWSPAGRPGWYVLKNVCVRPEFIELDSRPLLAVEI